MEGNDLPLIMLLITKTFVIVTILCCSILFMLIKMVSLYTKPSCQDVLKNGGNGVEQAFNKYLSCT